MKDMLIIISIVFILFVGASFLVGHTTYRYTVHGSMHRDVDYTDHIVYKGNCIEYISRGNKVVRCGSFTIE